MVRQRIWKNLCKRKDTFKAENAQVCSMHFNYGSYKWGLEHELLNLTPRKNKNKCSTKSATSYSTIPKPEDQCDKKVLENLHESTSFQTPSSVDNQGEDQVDFVSPRSRREMRRQNKQMVTNLLIKEPKQKNKAIWIQTEYSLFLENTDNLKAELKKTKADLCKQKVRVNILTKKLE
ncbi:unnamed protein product [Lepeophtheirus salmonis]|uniref:(salmon louse) hypothetical protein n=1 Tax=Lepeophtheirus salmonis TaxID=72036 RepID=A0A7R8CGX9_LEPSM|nr:unnamed protein product [Lepeophtheirus salmonis]CAF2814705.1 unnamed protein product [Lepeophtheirus salmonis]